MTGIGSLASVRRKTILFLLAGGSAINAAEPVLGVWEGSGRACYGKLVVKPTSIAWKTPFSSCQESAYTILKNSSGASDAIVLERKHRNKGCLFRVVSLKKSQASPDSDLWDAVGYVTAADYKAEDVSRATMCGVFRISGK